MWSSTGFDTKYGGCVLVLLSTSDHEYPPRVAHTMLQRILDDFSGTRHLTFSNMDLITSAMRIRMWIRNRLITGFWLSFDADFCPDAVYIFACHRQIDADPDPIQLITLLRIRILFDADAGPDEDPDADPGY